jgi:hypothetical protein
VVEAERYRKNIEKEARRWNLTSKYPVRKCKKDREEAGLESARSKGKRANCRKAW